MASTKPQTRPTVAIRQATRILGTDEAGVAALVKEGRLTEMHTRPTSGDPEAIYNVTELEAIVATRKAEAEIARLRPYPRPVRRKIDAAADMDDYRDRCADGGDL